MKRRLFTVLVALSVLMCVVTVVIWVRSYWVVDTFGWSDSRHFVNLVSSGGRLNLTHTVWDHRTEWKAGWSFKSRSRRELAPQWETEQRNGTRRQFLGFEWSDGLWPMSEFGIVVSFYVPTYRLIAVPYWAISVLFASPLLAKLLVVARRRGRLRRNLCPTCGYDLRATPERCPECGAEVKVKAATG